ncbi:hypothetical protein V6N13_004934 [Hibiscus sabdariffa]|uniref:Uncharacterized protein n=1 Tax=Hibiscus sabdariffa TaxID=183260 RepID=A0ABR2S0J0_9ROSI
MTGDLSKVELLKSFPHADTNLVLFEADINKPNEFEVEPAIHGCTFVFHVATPLQNSDASQVSPLWILFFISFLFFFLLLILTNYEHFKNTTEAAVSAIKSIAESCIKSGTVKRLIYTASVCSASPLKDDGNGYEDSMDETCWTPLDLSLAYSNDFCKDYTLSKTLTEELLGKLPIVHINDVFEALFFCIVNPSIGGRFLIASSFVSAAELAECYRTHYPEFNVKAENLDGPKSGVKWGSTKLIEKGFEYKCKLKMIMDDSSARGQLYLFLAFNGIVLTLYWSSIPSHREVIFLRSLSDS